MKSLPPGYHSVGAEVHNIHTKQKGKVVRIVPVSDLFQQVPDHLKTDTVAYVVALPESRSGVAEAVWFESEILKTDDQQQDSVSFPSD